MAGVPPKTLVGRASQLLWWMPASLRARDGPAPVRVQADESGSWEIRRLPRVTQRQEPLQKEPVMGLAGRPTAAIELGHEERETPQRWTVAILVQGVGAAVTDSAGLR